MKESNPHHQESIAVDQADATTDDLLDAVEDLAATVNEQAERIAELEQEVEDLRDEQADHQEETARERAEDRQRVTAAEERLDDVEDRLTSDEPHPSDTEDTDAGPSQKPQTPLEQTVALPESMVEDETANVQRAVFVASDVADYTTKVPAGRAIKSSELRRVLKAGTDCRGHSQTVDRVMSVLDDLGGDGVEVVERRGQRRVVFSEDLAERLTQLSDDGERGDSHTVVIEKGV